MLFAALNLHSQKIWFGGSYTNTNAFYLKNIPGVILGYDHQIWKLNLFAQAFAGKQDHSYTENYLATGYIIQIGQGEILKGNLNLGLGVNALSSNHYRISIGAFFGLNYLHRKEDITSFYFEKYYIGNIYKDTIDDFYKNRPEYGFFLDAELMKVVIEQLSVFTRLEFGQTFLEKGHMPRGVPFIVWEYNSFSFSFGMRYCLKTNNPNP